MIKLTKYYLPILVLMGLAHAAVSQNDSLPDKTVTVDTLTGVGTSQLGEYHQAYFKVEALNSELPARPAFVNLQTPQAAMEHYLLSVQAGEFEKAAYAMNFNLLPGKIGLKEGALLAEKLYYLMHKRIQIDWDQLPDRADGQINQSAGGSKAIAGKPRRSISMAMLSAGNRDVPVRLERYKVNDEAPVWLISANTVQNIEYLYREQGPGWVERHMPDWLKFELFGLVFWKFLGILVFIVICYFLAKFIRSALKRITLNSDKSWIKGIGNQVATPLALTISIMLMYVALNNALSLTGDIAPFVYAVLLVVVIGCITWLIMRILDYAMDRFQEHQVGDISDEENLESRKFLTNISVGRRVFTFIIIIAGIGVVLSQFPSLQSIGISLMASAGIATVILGIAAQSTLGNIIAGLNIAITKPIRIGDAVIFEDEYGTIEDIKFTYLIIKTWDWRRIIVPLQYFITHPFENWSKSDPNLLKPISLFVDFTFDVEKLRKKFDEILREMDNYNEEYPPEVQVVGSTKDAIEVRAVCSAKDATTAWDLHCKLREKLMRFVADEGMIDQLPKERVELEKQSS